MDPREAPLWTWSAGETILPVVSNNGSLICVPGWIILANGYFLPSVSVETMPLSLNPFADSWHPAINRAPEADRSLFLTFSNGRPLTQNEIFRFFTDLYGNCVERVYVHWRGEKNDESSAQFGKILFTGATIPQVLTACGAKECKFSIDGKPLWCKRFDPSKTRFFWKN